MTNYRRSVTPFAIMSKPEPDLSAVCVSCGLCCNGTLFQVAPLTKAEYSNLIAVLDVELDSNGDGFLQLPCGALAGTTCTRYETRMDVCRDFRCGVLDGVTNGELDAEKAVEVVTQTRQLAIRLSALLPASTGTKARTTLTQRVKNRYHQLKKVPSSEWTSSDREFLLAAGSFLIMLAKYYKLEELAIDAAAHKPATASPH